MTEMTEKPSLRDEFAKKADRVGVRKAFIEANQKDLEEIAGIQARIAQRVLDFSKPYQLFETGQVLRVTDSLTDRFVLYALVDSVQIPTMTAENLLLSPQVYEQQIMKLRRVTPTGVPRNLLTKVHPRWRYELEAQSLQDFKDALDD